MTENEKARELIATSETTVKGEFTMNTYNVVISVSTTVCIDAESADDAIEKVSQALNNGDANMSTDIANNIGYSMRNGHYEVTNAIPMDE